MLDLQIRTLNGQYPEKTKTKTTDRTGLALRFMTESEKDFVNFMRYDAQIERAFYRALNTLEKLQAARKRQETATAGIRFKPATEPRPLGSGRAPATLTNHNEIGFVS